MTDRYGTDYRDREEKRLMEGLDQMDAEALGRPSRQRQEDLRRAAREHRTI